MMVIMLFIEPGFVLSLLTYSSIKLQLLPLVAIAIMIDAVLVSIWYIIATLLNNPSLKAGAVNEAYQLFGNIAIAVLVLFLLITFSQFFYTALQGNASLNNANISKMCGSLENNSQSNLLNSSLPSNYNAINPLPFKGSLLSGIGGFPGYCALAKYNHKNTTSEIDYPVTTSAIILANLTNQNLNNLNDLFATEAYVGFLSKLTATFSVCVANPATAPTLITLYLEPCVVPFMIAIPILSRDTFEFTPLAGYSKIYTGLGTLGGLITTSLESFIAQLFVITAFVYIWPVLLFIGLALRSVFLTRRLGGLFIALAVAFVLFYPAIFSIEYITLDSSVTSVPTLAVGGSALIANVVNASDPSQQLEGSNYNISHLNFFVQPNLEDIAKSTSCWYGYGGSLISKEGSDIITLDSYGTLASMVSVAYGGLTGAIYHNNKYSSTFSYLSGFGCNENEALETLFLSYDAYGITGISAYWLPILNIIIVLAGVKGLSGLLGGDTELAGLGRLI